MTGFILACSSLLGHSQVCPPNIDFESGTFNGWTCYTGYVTGAGVNVMNLSPSGGPEAERHTMYSSFPGDGLDPYGGFPINCPNGSGHSIRLGNSFGGGQAEGISYEFTIPSNENYYTLIYNYAVVFQDPDHQEYEQPRMEIEVRNLTDNTIIHCSSFTFIPYGNILPGFFESPNPGTETPVWCKDWTAVSINLDGHAGKSIRIFFKTSDCTFQRHFGYAYIDVNSECSGTFTGATFCPDDTLVNVVAPFGYQSYTWFNNTFTQTLGQQQVLTLQPPPPAGTTIAVQLVPYNGYGCLDTLYARLVDTLTVRANAGNDAVSCNNDPVPIGTPPKPGLVYRWSPAAGLSNAYIANPRASPDTTTMYILTVNHDGGGCYDTDTVVVRASVLNRALQFSGKDMYCLGSNDSAVLRVQPTDNIQWFRNGTALPGATEPVYRATQTGSYHASLSNTMGCSMVTDPKQVTVTSVPVPGVNIGAGNQCLVGNRFVFTNTSTNAVGAMQYEWILGDGNTVQTMDVTHSYFAAGVYTVNMIVRSSPVCFDSASMLITVYQNAIADFEVNPVCINLPMQAVNRTMDTLGSPIHYAWNFSNGQTSTLRVPAPQVYTTPGSYQVSLAVHTDQCPSPVNVLRKNVVVDRPRPGIEYPVQFAVINYPLALQARPFGETVLWSPAANLNNQESFTPVFTGSSEQLYTIRITTVSGCVTVDTQIVKTVKEAAIYVPTAFTPNNDGLNDRLRPVLIGIKELRYFRIFNRWGQLIYQSKTELPGWDGTVSGIPQGSQAFVWMIEGLSIDNRVITSKGTSTLVR
ncbi:MAG: gliding motility-associated C-terminal domain-containing protein [Chitinophagaceae bacterium]|nr:gliding motility-associated C-terminal domain-containing protein [Chitinophagaceae bacterium]